MSRSRFTLPAARSGHLPRRRRLSLVPVVLALALVGALPAGPVRPDLQPVAVDALAFSSSDVGFAEGHSVDDADLDRRLNEMVAYVPGRSPLLRVDLNWWYVQDCRDCPLRWDRLDPVLAAARARDIRVLLVLAYAPPWANGDHPNDKWFPVRDADWTAIVAATARHVGDTVVAYEVWNEPNNGAIPGYDGFGNYAGDRRARYWQLVRLAAQTIRPICPSCVILAGASGNGTPQTATSNPNESGAWLDWAYTNGYRDSFDAVAHHPYPAWNSGKGPAEPECATRWWNQFGPPGQSPICGQLANLRSIMVRHGDAAKKIWGTEYGYPTSGATALPITTVRDHLAQGVGMWRSLSYTGPLFLYSYRDACVTATDPECAFGVVRRDFTPKAGLHADLSRVLADTWQPALRSGESIRRWAAVRSTDDRFETWLQEDGNLVLYRRHGAALWATQTRDGVSLVNQADGNLVLRRANGTTAWSTGTAGQGPATLWMQEDGNLVLYRDRDGRPIWASGTV
ncbi:cellulase family glycosylhydrolase [Micromonospora endophytica]|uniref:Bulb-type lectin domain-containing protein n=1 Tax=Micromonospora endophytica TaxID=515350 RepID=A0A2W2CS57_9ACTN|nr:cellulase family glycosylhydrolase [Micromonospora endophytica]PZG00711.1 hypothetical protein C1I93_01605 [Micromonospora endophytica]RIW44833.1 hypothetical protein D3H59_16750 [Micromonospora endophytica]